MNSDGFPLWDQKRVKRYKELGLWENETFGEMLTRLARIHPDKVALTWHGQHLTYAELNHRVERSAKALLAFGLKQGDKVIVQLPNSFAFFEGVFALFKIGVLPVFCLPSHRFHEISHIAMHVEAVAYLTSEKRTGFDYVSLAHEVKESCPELVHIFSFDEMDGLVETGQFEGETDLQVKVDPDSYAFLQLSGGSTGLPKLIPRTHNDYYYSVRRSNELCGINEESVYLAVLPVAHNYPLSSPGVLGLLLGGGRIVLADSGSADEAFQLIEKEQVTITALVPPLALVWLEAVKHRKEDLSSLQVIQVGGAKCSAEVAKRIGPAFQCTLQQVFGMAEGLVNYTRLTDSEDKILYTQGKPMSEYDEIRIVDEHENDLGLNIAGELWTRGPYTIPGYFKADDHNRKSFSQDGFYKTGDVASVTDDGYLIVQGRMKDQINRGGEKVAAEEVENQLLAHETIFDAAIVAIPDDYLGERVCAYIILNKSFTIEAKEVKAYLRSKGLADYKIPDVVHFVDSFPETGVGKVSKQQLRQAIVQKVLMNN
ncbi:(2,3-dihydroxybenzoyl)adenylate synthase [Alkalicoccobacillus plakortidis]|uniref:AMP-binding protein n=1 Tax=Alkalicoccobacillus plakortidis TaxID=444060 RepID=A0ABT0XNR5_9BACI|nr:AMP-binding protein [Alkalicoccobacillus plakortidis]MCM2677365.1 AMP-binding protein [Alkalicoccobacillus plakortidis]